MHPGPLKFIATNARNAHAALGGGAKPAAPRSAGGGAFLSAKASNHGEPGSNLGLAVPCGPLPCNSPSPNTSRAGRAPACNELRCRCWEFCSVCTELFRFFHLTPKSDGHSCCTGSHQQAEQKAGCGKMRAHKAEPDGKPRVQVSKSCTKSHHGYEHQCASLSSLWILCFCS